jgi:hypothetical protein
MTIQSQVTINKTNKSLENVVNLKYLGTKLKSYCTHTENECQLNSGNPCYHSGKNTLSSHLSESKKIKIYKYTTVILPDVLHGCGSGL